jgi:murein DD-endopeptidase MepM/ murein hydrolase activator NlpD
VKLNHTLGGLALDNKFITVMIIPDRKSKLRKIVLSAGHVKLGLWLGGLILIILSAVVVDYVTLLSQSIENKRLHAENAELRNDFKVVEAKLSTLETALERIKVFSTKLKLITASNDSDRTLNLAMGPLSRNNDSIKELQETDSERIPASKLTEPVNSKEEASLKEKLNEDLSSGELARETDHDYSKLSIRLDQAGKQSKLREQGILELWDLLQDKSALLSSTPSTKPTKGWYTSKFGYRVSPYTDKPLMHEGLDIAAAPGAPVYSPADGTVTFAGYDAGFGKLIVIDHGYGVETRYGHNSQIKVSAGQKVKHGDLISAVGSTGRSTGPHLHYEVRVDGQPVDPTSYILND